MQKLPFLLTVLSLLHLKPCLGDNLCKSPPKPSFSECCYRPKLLDNRDFQGCNRLKVYKNQATAVCAEYECFFIRAGFYLNSTINVEAIQKYMIKVSREEGQMSQRTDFQSVISSAAESCVEKIQDVESVLRELFTEDPFDINPYECDVTFISVINCIYYDIFVNCPKEAWETSLTCEDWKEYINTCMDDIETFPHIDMNKMFND